MSLGNSYVASTHRSIVERITQGLFPMLIFNSLLKWFQWKLVADRVAVEVSL